MRIRFLSVVFVLLAALNTQGETQMKVSPYGKVLKNDDVVAEIVTIDGKNSQGLSDILLRLTGIAAHEAEIDQRVMRYKAARAGTGEDYSYNDGKGDRNRMISRPSGYEVYLNGKTYKLKPDEKASKELKTETLLHDFLKK